jgi:hypothetical protein
LLRKLASALAAVGVALSFVCIWVDSLPRATYWSGDATFGAFCLLLACLAALTFALGLGRAQNGALVAVGAVMLGFYGFLPALLAFGDWDQTRAGMWIALAAAVAIVVGGGLGYREVSAAATPAGLSAATLTAGLGVALAFPGIFVRSSGSESYWAASGHSLGVVILVVAVVMALVWIVTVAGVNTHGLDQVLALALLGLALFVPFGAAWNNFGQLGPGAWLLFAGAILAAGGIWAARGAIAPGPVRPGIPSTG